MPRERIHHGATYVTAQETSVEVNESGEPLHSAILTWKDDGLTPIPDGATIERDPSLDINWQREGETVQLSIEMDAAAWDRFNTGREGAVKSAIYTPSLARHEINLLIRTLRRARDAAYGADE